MFLTATNVFHYLRDVGQVSAGDVLDENFAVTEIGRRNRNFKILRRDGDSLFVKQVPIVHPETAISFRREAACAQIAAEGASDAALASVLPRLRRYDPQAQVLIYEALEPSESISELVSRTHMVPVDIARRWATTVAACHVETSRPGALVRIASALSAQPPWVFSIAQTPELIMPNMNGGRRHAVDTIRATPELAVGLAELHARWRRLCLTHGDLKWDNVLLVGPDENEREIRLIDWELADLGDPLWDVASGLCSFLQFWLLKRPVQQSPVDLQPAIAQAPLQIGTVQEPARAFWQAYVERVATALPVTAEDAVRTARLIGARLVLLTFELMPTADRLTPHAALSLQVARFLFADPVRASRRSVRADARAAFTAYRHASGAAAVGRGSPMNVAALPVPDHEQRLDVLFKNLDILSASDFSLGGSKISTSVGAFVGFGPGTPPYGPSPQLRDTLASVLYFSAYARVYAGGAFDLDVLSRPVVPDPNFTAALSSANPTAIRWEPGWQIFQLEQAGAVHVLKGDRATLVQPGQYTFAAGGGRSPRLGDAIEILVPRESLHHQPGMYFAFGETVGSDYDLARIGRFYFNAAASDAAWLIARLGDLLNRYAVPYRFKCALDPAVFDRTDGAVLYLARKFVPLFLRIFEDLGQECAARLQAGTPLFTKPLCRGVGMADDPGSGESFGQLRSRLLAEGILDAWQAGNNTPAARRAAVAARFSQSGLRIEQPHLASGLVDIYLQPTAEAA